MSNVTEFVVSTALGSIGTVIVGWVVSKYIDQMNERINEHQKVTLERIADLAGRINGIESKYSGVLDIVLDKFSKWEDRILGLISKMGETSPKEMQDEIDRFREEATNDIADIKLKVARVSVEVAKITSEPLGDEDKKIILAKLDTVRDDLDNRVKYIEDNFAKFVKLLNTINTKQREHEFKIDNLTATRISSRKD